MWKVVTTIFGERFTAATTSPEQIPSSGKTLGHSTLAVRLALGSSHPKVSEFIIIIIIIYIYLYVYMCYIYIYIYLVRKWIFIKVQQRSSIRLCWCYCAQMRPEGNFYAIVKLMLAWTCQAGSSPELLLDMTFWKWCRDEGIVENDEIGISWFHGSTRSMMSRLFQTKGWLTPTTPPKKGELWGAPCYNLIHPRMVNLGSSGIWIHDMCMFPNIANACSHAHKHKDTHTHTCLQ